MLAEAGQGESVVMATIDCQLLRKQRRQIPVMQHQRLFSTR
ncbi:hypothetical protein [Dongshaea marina]|nr:hypothetical protein [Dongshaea marina]